MTARSVLPTTTRQSNSPRDKDIRRTRGLFHLLTDEFEKARGDLEAAIETDPEDASLQEALGLSLMMDNKLEAAEEAFDRAIKLDPESSGGPPAAGSGAGDEG